MSSITETIRALEKDGICIHLIDEKVKLTSQEVDQQVIEDITQRYVQYFYLLQYRDLVTEAERAAELLDTQRNPSLQCYYSKLLDKIAVKEKQILSTGIPITEIEETLEDAKN